MMTEKQRVSRKVVLNPDTMAKLMMPEYFSGQEFRKCVKGLPGDARFKKVQFEPTVSEIHLIFESTEWDEENKDEPVEIKYETVEFSENVLGRLK